MTFEWSCIYKNYFELALLKNWKEICVERSCICKIYIKKQPLNFQVNVNARLAESSVFERSIEIVIGPNPPGTGVMADTTPAASS